MKHDLVAAAKIQQAFLPTDGGAGFGGRVLRGAIVPCDELAGDTLNILPLDDNHVACFVVDVRGHGVPAVAALGNPEPADVRRRQSPRPFCGFTTTHDPSRGSPHPSRSPISLARSFPYDEDTGQYFTLLYGVPSTSRRMSSDSSRRATPISPTSRPAANPCYSSLPAHLLASFPRASCRQPSPKARSSCRRETALYIYSDGIPEAADPTGAEFGDKRLVETLGGLFDVGLEDSIQVLLDRVSAFSETPHFEDDVSVVVFEVSG